MPRTAATVLEERFTRAKDKVRRLDGQLADARLEASRTALAALEAGARRSRLADIWGTNINQIDLMLARARKERR
jgi:hypothetical protein